VEVVLEVMEASSGYRPAPLEGARDAAAPAGDEDQVVDRQALRELLGVLTERDRRIVVLAWYADWTQDRIAASVGISQVQVSRVLRRSAELIGRAAHPGPPEG
jgi:RNA polymerase sigma-B factor